MNKKRILVLGGLGIAALILYKGLSLENKDKADKNMIELVTILGRLRMLAWACDKGLLPENKDKNIIELVKQILK